MAQFDLYAGMEPGLGYVVDVQADLLDALTTRVVVPIRSTNEVEVVRDLTPVVDIEGSTYVLLTQELTAVARSELRRPVGSLATHRDDIRRALDILLVGF